MDRRAFLKTSALCGVGLAGAPQLLLGQRRSGGRGGSPHVGGCSWTHASESCSRPPEPSETFSSSGNPRLDRALIAEVRKVDRVFGISPGYRFFDDRACPNCWATSDTYLPGTWGTIAFGLTLFSFELQREFGGAAAAGIAGHEGAHIYQYSHGYIPYLAGSTAQYIELHADFLAGYYFARSGRTERSIEVFGQSLNAMGSTDFTRPDFHGTGRQRVASMLAGYRSRRTSIEGAADEGVDFVRRL